jgi:site-specific DNA-methyltransferase (adenine-specific)
MERNGMKTDLLDLKNMDCMDLMRDLPDNHFDLAIVDPPYGIGMSGGNVGYKGNNDLERKEWDSATPDADYFVEIKRVSVNQIVWGANYFQDVWPTRSFALWDKGAGFRGRTYAEGELAATTFDRNAQIFSHDPLSGRDYVGKIHPTQKPVALYKWLLQNYAKPGQKILDTHMGSGSIAIACHYFGAHLTATELDPDYFKAACERIEKETAQADMFTGDDFTPEAAQEEMNL